MRVIDIFFAFPPIVLAIFLMATLGPSLLNVVIVVAYTAAARLIAQNTDRPYIDVKMPFYWGPHVSNEKARSMLGYEPQYSFDRMVETALAHQRGDAIDQIPS